jgi:predicted nucleotidyltransferase
MTATSERFDVEAERRRLGAMTAGELRQREQEIGGDEARSRNREYLIRRILWMLQAGVTAAVDSGLLSPLPIQTPITEIADFCRRHGIARLSLFGSVLREDFSPSSDIDVLVEFQAGKAPGFIGFAGLQMELSKILGRTVDLRTPADLSGYFRDEVLREARLLHAA